MLLDILSGKVSHANNILNYTLRKCVPKLYAYKETNEADCIIDGLTTAQYTLLGYFRPEGEIFKDVKTYSSKDVEKLYIIVTIMSIYDTVANDLLEKHIADESIKLMSKIFDVSPDLIKEYQEAVIYNQSKDSVKLLNGIFPTSIGISLWRLLKSVLCTLPEYDPEKDMMKVLTQSKNFDSSYSYAFIMNKNKRVTLTVS